MNLPVKYEWNVLIYSILSKTTELRVYIKLEQWWSDMKIPDFFTFYLSNHSISQSFSAVPWTSRDRESPVMYLTQTVWWLEKVLISHWLFLLKMKLCFYYTPTLKKRGYTKLALSIDSTHTFLSFLLRWLIVMGWHLLSCFYIFSS